MNTSVAVVVPVYSSVLSVNEKISITFLKKYLSCYPIVVVCPRNLNLPKELGVFPTYRQIEFDQQYFHNVKSYSELLLTTHFYRQFIDYDYILIYQLDALVFNNNLDYWVSKNYDYIGSPWMNSVISFLSNKDGNATIVGNGGLSLRKVKSCLETLSLQNKVSQSRLTPIFQFLYAVVRGKSRSVWFKSLANKYPFNEDGFWSLEAPKINRKFKVASVADGKKFAWEKNPRYFFHELKKLPFGAHAWQRYDREFWQEILDLPSNI